MNLLFEIFPLICIVQSHFAVDVGQDLCNFWQYFCMMHTVQKALQMNTFYSTHNIFHKHTDQTLYVTQHVTGELTADLPWLSELVFVSAWGTSNGMLCVYVYTYTYTHTLSHDTHHWKALKWK